MVALQQTPRTLFWRSFATLLMAFVLTLAMSGLDIRQSLAFGGIGVSIGVLVFLWRKSLVFAIGVAATFPVSLSFSVDWEQAFELSQRYQVSIALLLMTLAGIVLATRRWVLATAVALSLVGGLAIVSFIKFDYVGAPLIWPDISNGLRSWDLFLEMETANFLAAIGICVMLSLLWFLEPAGRHPMRPWAALACGGLGLIVLVGARLPDQHSLLELSFGAREGRLEADPSGVFLGSLLHVRALRDYPVAGPDTEFCCLRSDRLAERLDRRPATLPHVVVVLLESTFDPRPLEIGERRGFFPDAHPLDVHTVGGATWVAEYALLHGVPPPLYGPGYQVINLLGPGLADGRLPVILRSIGYGTTTIYPVAGRFYGARAFHASLGMERFIPCEDVLGCEGRPWQERADRVFLDQALWEMGRSPSPQFIFLPTIQQHSPHLPKVGAGGTAACAVSDLGCLVMTEYRRRLDTSLADFARFQDRLREGERDTVVLAFGDHIPADVNRYVGKDRIKDGRKQTFFTVWHSRKGYITSDILGRAGSPTRLDIAFLDWVVAASIGLDSKYFRHKEAMIRRCGGDYCLAQGSERMAWR